MVVTQIFKSTTNYGIVHIKWLKIICEFYLKINWKKNSHIAGIIVVDGVIFLALKSHI